MAQAANVTSNQPDDDAVVAVNLSKIRAAQDAAASHHGSLRSVMKHAEGKGVNLKAAKRALAIAKGGDAKAWLEETSEITRYLRILRHGINESQLQLEFEASSAPIDEKAGLDGRAAGLDGALEASNPHDMTTLAGQAWIKAYRQGLSERGIILSMAADEAADDDEADDFDEEDADDQDDEE